MTTEPLSGSPGTAPPPQAAAAPSTAEGASGQARAAAAAEGRRFRINPQYIAPILVTCVLLGANFYYQNLESPWKTALAIVSAMAAEVVLGRLFYGKWPSLASAYVTGISVGILIRSPYYWPYAVCSLISITSKYVFRVRGRHIWNPSNFGISTMVFLAPAALATLSIQWDNRVIPLLIIWTLGSIIIARLKRFHICLTYLVSFIALSWVRSLLTGDSFWAEVAPVTGPMYQLFILFMITDPKTTVKSRNGQIVVAFLVALVEFALRTAGHYFPYTGFSHIFVHAPYLALFTVGPIANLIEIYRTPPKPAPAAGPPPAARD